jgi:hypothetical protein
LSRWNNAALIGILDITGVHSLIGTGGFTEEI